MFECLNVRDARTTLFYPTRDNMGCLGSNLGWPCTRQAPYPLSIFLAPDFLFFKKIIDGDRSIQESASKVLLLSLESEISKDVQFAKFHGEFRENFKVDCGGIHSVSQVNLGR